MASSNHDQDGPPPLEDCAEYLTAQQYFRKQSAAGNLKTGSKRDTTSLADVSNKDFTTFLRIVPSTQNADDEPKSHQNSSNISKPLKRGFLNAKPTSGAKSNLNSAPVIKASKPAEKVPEFFKLDLRDDPQEQLRKEMKDMLKPTQELVSDVLRDEEIQAGLEDPEIMMAVQDIASNPSAMHKYKHCPKIVNFYNSMGKLMGDRIEKQEKEKNKNKKDRGSGTNYHKF